MLDYILLDTKLQLCASTCPDPAVKLLVIDLQNTKGIPARARYMPVLDALLRIVRDAEASIIGARLGAQPGAATGTGTVVGTVAGAQLGTATGECGTGARARAASDWSADVSSALQSQSAATGAAAEGVVANDDDAMLVDQSDVEQSSEGGGGERRSDRSAIASGLAPAGFTAAAAARALPDPTPAPPSPVSPPATGVRHERVRQVLTRTPGSAGMPSEPTAMEMGGREAGSAASGDEIDDDEEEETTAAATTSAIGSPDFGTVLDAITMVGDQIYSEQDATAEQNGSEAAAADTTAAVSVSPTTTESAAVAALEPPAGSADADATHEAAPAPTTDAVATLEASPVSNNDADATLIETTPPPTGPDDNDDSNSDSDGDLRVVQLQPPRTYVSSRGAPLRVTPVEVTAVAGAASAVRGDGSNIGTDLVTVYSTAAAPLVAAAAVAAAGGGITNDSDPAQVQQPPLSAATTTADTTVTVTTAAGGSTTSSADIYAADVFNSFLPPRIRRLHQASTPPAPFTSPPSPPPSPDPVEQSPSLPVMEAEANMSRTQRQGAAGREIYAVEMGAWEGETSAGAGTETETEMETEMEMEMETETEMEIEMEMEMEVEVQALARPTLELIFSVASLQVIAERQEIFEDLPDSCVLKEEASPSAYVDSQTTKKKKKTHCGYLLKEIMKPPTIEGAFISTWLETHNKV